MNDDIMKRVAEAFDTEGYAPAVLMVLGNDIPLLIEFCESFAAERYEQQDELGGRVLYIFPDETSLTVTDGASAEIG